MQTRSKTPPQASKKASKAAPNGKAQSIPPLKQRKFVLTKVAHVRAELGRLYSEARNGLIDISDASRLGNLLAILHRVISDSDLEARLQAIEEQLQGKRS